MLNNELLMELTQEQGPGRETQVQPPKAVWLLFFYIDLDSPPATPPVFLSHNQLIPNAPVEQYPFVFHHHNATVEIPEVGTQRPAILRLRRTGQTSFDYWVYRSGTHPEYGHCDWLLNTFPNPYWQAGRRWIIV
jgi:hypothetical protein